MSFKFREWQVYKDAREFRKDIIKDIITLIPKDERYELISQLKRALNSIILNIAEGAYRQSDKDLSHFLNQADTSVNEVVACLDICLDDVYIDKNIHKKFLNKAENLIAQLSGFRNYLKNN